MLTVRGRHYKHCDGITRRHFLTAGAIVDPTGRPQYLLNAGDPIGELV